MSPKATMGTKLSSARYQPKAAPARTPLWRQAVATMTKQNKSKHVNPTDTTAAPTPRNPSNAATSNSPTMTRGSTSLYT